MPDITDRIRHEVAVEKLAEQFGKVRVKKAKETTKVSNNGWNKVEDRVYELHLAATDQWDNDNF